MYQFAGGVDVHEANRIHPAKLTNTTNSQTNKLYSYLIVLTQQSSAQKSSITI
jgi:hypothetical protein